MKRNKLYIQIGAIYLIILVGIITIFSLPILQFLTLKEKIELVFNFVLAFGSILIPIILWEIKQENERHREREEQMKYFGKLYQYFMSSSFRIKRKVAWITISRAIKNPDYADLLVSRSYVSIYCNELHPNYTKTEKKIYKSFYSCSEKTPSLAKEYDAEHMLDDVVSFFKILADLDFSEVQAESIDFYYDSWRPVLYWYALKLEEGYEAHSVNEKYNNPPSLRKSIEKLDRKLARFQLSKDIQDLEKHPIIRGIKCTSKYTKNK